ncbi:thiolase family protein [Lujinxingia vulgaris]|uniref:Thiolase family protein n=1 Tax=Lujinxingia vulgaris TaxID=2600176 RepID=A0A5C6WZE8_9DELT|nr:thiolase family protein [Lujinxingia vulgaris]TXD34148.1 thiolase family protein [Lujinxingia vulgaris]
MAEAYVYEAVRSPIGRRKGGLSEVRPDELAAAVLRALVERAGVDAAEIEDVIMGCVTQLGEQGLNIARNATLVAGFPITVCGTTVNRMCGSSLTTINFAAQAVMSGAHDLVVGAGVESMSRVAMGSDSGPLSDLLTDRFDIVSQGVSADLIAERWGLSRKMLDELAVESHRRALSAIEEGRFEREIAPVFGLSQDEGPRADSTYERVAKLRPAFQKEGVITAASSSQISDGAAAVLIGSAEAGERLGLKPRARVRSMALAGVDPTIMLTGPIPATEKALKKAGLGMEDIDLFEVNEAFASVVLAWARELGGSDGMGALLERTNVNGGAMALGHPLGCSGARLLTTLLHEMERRDVELGLATLCIGFGQAVATVIERV